MPSPPSTPNSFSLLPKSKSLFEESPLINAGGNTRGHGVDDLSLSELSMNDTPVKKPVASSHGEPPRFSLFGALDSPQPQREESIVEEFVSEAEIDPDQSNARHDPGQLTEADLTTGGENEASPSTTPTRARTPQQDVGTRRSREAELQSALFQMRKVNAVLVDYLDALNATEARNQVLAHQVENSQRLLKKYTALLSQTEHTTRLILDPQWQGAEADEERAAEQAEHEARERERLAREEEERLERLERERIAKEMEAERQRELKEKAKAGGERGRPGASRVRGRGGLTRGTTSTSTGPSPTGRGRGIPPPSGLRRPTVIRSGIPSTRSRGRGTS